MEKRLTYEEARSMLGEESYKCEKAICDKWRDKKIPGRDGAYTPELKALHEKFGRRFFKLKEEYKSNATLPESEVMKIVMGDF